MKDGVYFDLPEAEYHALPRCSQSLIKRIAVSTYECWSYSWMGPLSERSTVYMDVGDAQHKSVLEGPEALNKLYAPEFVPPDNPDIPDTVADMKAACKARGLPVSGNKPELAERLAGDGIDTVFALQRDYENAHSGKTFLPADSWEQIELATKMIRGHPLLSKMVSGGFSEVTILWTDEKTGLPCKARIDYLKEMALVDYKTFINKLGKPLARAVATAVASYGYHVQAAVYSEAVDIAAENGWIEPVERRFIFLFQQKGPCPVAIAREMPRSSSVMSIGGHVWHSGLRQFKACLDKWGPDKAWIDDVDLLEFDDLEFPVWINEL